MQGDAWQRVHLGSLGLLRHLHCCTAQRGCCAHAQAARRRSLPWLHAQVCGEGHEVEGDAVVPLGSALLEGSEHVVLDGVLHSMSRVRTFDAPSQDLWYGSDPVVDSWLHHLVK